MAYSLTSVACIFPEIAIACAGRLRKPRWIWCAVTFLRWLARAIAPRDDPVRLFVAMDLSEQVRAAIANFCEKLRRAYPAAKWVRIDGMHVTLKFIGWIADEKLGAIRGALTGLRSASHAEMHFRGVGFFPLREASARLMDRRHRKPERRRTCKPHRARLEPLGIEREKREFRPHLTLARFDAPRGLQPLQDALRDSSDVDFGIVRTNEFHLYQSELLRGGAKYTRLASFPVAPEGAS